MPRSGSSLKNPEELKIDAGASAEVTALVYRSDTSPSASLILAHGAGAGQQSPFLVSFARALSARGLDVVTFNFPYTEQNRRVPDRRPVLDGCYVAIINRIHRHMPSASRSLFIGGKSMGGRIATHVAAADANLPVAGLVLLGYPLHPPGRPTERRDAHLGDVRRPMLIVQGSRDTFGTPAEFESLLHALSPAPVMHVVEGGDHSFKIRGGKSAQESVYDGVQRTIVEWTETVRRGGRENP
jgi:predicted alpha/beta-hydrolase family hydrolase